MHFSFRIATVMALASAAFVSALPVQSPGQIEARSEEFEVLEARYTRQECEVACSLAHAPHPTIAACVEACMAHGLPTPPPSPPPVAAKKVKKVKRTEEFSVLEARYTRQECEVACSLAHAPHPTIAACVEACMAHGLPTPPPSPPPVAAKKLKKVKRAEEFSVLEARYTRQECEVACSLAHAPHPTIAACVEACMAHGLPTPPPSPPPVASKKVKKVKRAAEEYSVLEARYTRQECEVACSLAHAPHPTIAACVEACMAHGLPTPPPSPPPVASKKVKKVKRSEYSVLEARYTRQECEVACSLAHAPHPTIAACVEACMAHGLPTPPPSPPPVASKKVKKAKRSEN